MARAETLPHRVYNATSGQRASAREVFETLYRLEPGARALLGVDPASLPGEIGPGYQDITRIQEDLGWKPRFNRETMLKDYLASVRQYGN